VQSNSSVEGLVLELMANEALLSVPDEARVPAEPVGNRDRIPTLDVIRGFGVLGILIVNIQSFALLSDARVIANAPGDNLFPMACTVLFDVSPVMQPSDSLVGLASRRPESTQRTLRKRGIHNVAVQLLKHRYKGVQIEIPEADQSPLGDRPVVSSLEATWILLFRQAHTKSAIEPESSPRHLIDRANEVAKLTLSSGAYRYPMEIGEDGKRLACPVRPRRTAEVCDSNLWIRLQKLQPEKIFDGVRIFIDRAEKDGWVRFDSLADADLAILYIPFLYLAGFDRNKQVVTSSEKVEEWKRQLGYYGANLSWTPGLSALQSGLLIRPHPSAMDCTFAGFCFALVMTYIKSGFGRT
jgi:hypothetical protein